MALAVDVRMVFNSGIGTYLQNLIPRLTQSCELQLIGHAEDFRKLGWNDLPNTACEAPIYSLYGQLFFARKFFSESLWVPHYNIPLLHRGKLVVTVHDLCHLATPYPLHKRAYAKLLLAAVARSADAIICDSQFTADELMKWTGAEAGKITVVHLGVSESWFNIPESPTILSRPYLLAMGSLKHKNIARVLDAFEILRHSIEHDLVIIGKGKFPRNERIHFLNNLPLATLQQIVSHADALVFPSLYEGFGLPPLEAMACGVPVIVSDRGSLPEVCGDAALYCDPTDNADITTAVSRLLSEPSLRKELIISGKAHARKFTWDKCARETLSVLNHALQCSQYWCTAPPPPSR